MSDSGFLAHGWIDSVLTLKLSQFVSSPARTAEPAVSISPARANIIPISSLNIIVYYINNYESDDKIVFVNNYRIVDRLGITITK